METRSYTRQDLSEFIASDEFYRLENLPISKQRAYSQINNPRASDNDILLVVQFDDGKLIGYAGILPDYVYHDQEPVKVGWFTCFWADSKFKSLHVARNLFETVINAWEQKILVTNLVPQTASFYQKTGIFQPEARKTGIRGYLRFNLAEILPPRFRLFRKLAPLFNISDFLLNLPGDIRFLLFPLYKFGDTRYEYINHLDKAAADFINTHNKDNWNQRGKAELEWIIRYPWILEGIKNDGNGNRYYFSSFSRRFFYQTVKFSDRSGNITGLVLICVRNRNLTVPYLFYEKEGLGAICKLLINTMFYLRLNMVTTFHAELADAIKHAKVPFIYRKRIFKPYFIPKTLDFIRDLNFQDGDGDCAFY